MNVADFFNGNPAALQLHNAIAATISKIGPAVERASKSQIGFYRVHPFAATWIPRPHIGRDAPPLVLSIFLRRRDPSTRWKEVVEPAPGRFTHHMEIHSMKDLDEFIWDRLNEAWEGA